MKHQPFRVGDKVVLAVEVGSLTIVPQLVPGRVYCVREAYTLETKYPGTSERICLVGVRRDKRYSRPARHNMGDSLPAVYFARVSRTSSHHEKGEA